MRRLSSLLLVLPLASGIPFAHAQKESLLIGPGDLVHVQVFEVPDLDEHARVTDKGEIPLVLGGNVKVSGLTPDGASQAIEKVLLDDQYLRNPRITVTVEQYATQNVSVLGQVRSPGSYSIETARSVVDVLALAGGLTDVADRKITIERHDTKQRIDYYVSNSSQKALDTSVMVAPGDTIVVPKAG